MRFLFHAFDDNDNDRINFDVSLRGRVLTVQWARVADRKAGEALGSRSLEYFCRFRYKSTQVSTMRLEV